MPSQLHEGLTEMFRIGPAFAADLLAGPLGLTLPAFQQARLSAGELTDVAPTELRADAVVTLNRGDDPVFAVVIEVQLRADKRKRRTWPAYVATLHARLGCPAMLLVICPNQKVVRWCANPIVITDPGLTLTPVVVGPEQIPMITDVQTARRQPQMAVLSACAHGREDRPQVFEALFATLDTVTPDLAKLYIGLVFAALPKARRVWLEEFMTAVSRHRVSDIGARVLNGIRASGRAEGRAEGRTEGRAVAVLEVLAARGIDVPDDVRADIMACTDTARLDAWIQRAATAHTIEDVLG